MIFERRDFKYGLLLVIVAIGSFFLWRWIGGIGGINGYLTVDDLCSVQFSMIGEGLPQKISGIMAEDPTNVPIFYLFLYLWINIFGYAANIMRVLPQICGSMFIVIIGLIGKKIGGKKMGIIAAIIAGTSIQLIYVSYQIRAYSMLLLFSAIVFYAYLMRKAEWKSIIIYAVSLLLLSYTHFFGVLVCAALGSLDFFKVLLKKQKKVYLVSYVIYACLFLPYLVIALIKATDMWKTFWPPVPLYSDIISMIASMCPGTYGNWSIYVFGGVFFVYLVEICNLFIKKKGKSFVLPQIFACFWTIFAVLFVGFIYSRYISPEKSVWVYRYFLVLYPFIVTVISYGVLCIANFVEKKAGLSKIVIIGIMLFLFSGYTYTNFQYGIEHPEEVIIGGSDFEKVTDYIMTQKDIYKDKTLVYFGYPDQYFEGWKEYASQGGNKKLPNLCNSKDNFTKTDLSDYDTIYVVGIVFQLTEEELLYMGETHQLVQENCDGLYLVNKYQRY